MVCIADPGPSWMIARFSQDSPWRLSSLVVEYYTVMDGTSRFAVRMSSHAAVSLSTSTVGQQTVPHGITLGAFILAAWEVLSCSLQTDDI